MLDSLLAAVSLPLRIEPYIPWLTWFDKHLNVHPMLVSFTTALLTASLFSDYAAKVVGRESLRSTAAWCMLFAGIITPITGIMGWFFWGPGDDDPKVVGSMTIHMWLGTALVVCYIALAVWRWRYFRRNKGPGAAYLAAATVVFAAVLLQAKIGGDASFPPPKGLGLHRHAMLSPPAAKQGVARVALPAALPLSSAAT